MKKAKNRKRIQTVILVLSVLLAVDVAALAGTLIWRAVAPGKSATVTVPDNIISPGDQDPAILSPETQAAPSEGNAANETEESSTSPQDTGRPQATHETNPPDSAAAERSPSESQREAAVISLYRKHAEDNQPFQVANMFPGDTEIKDYCVQLSHSGDVTVHYRADVRPGYEKLAEVLHCRVALLSTGQTLYDGLMRDMPQSLTHSVKATERTETELYYEITAYLDTGVGNEYQNQELIADYRWWVQETGNLDSPDTGDTFQLYLWICMASGSLLILLFLVGKRRREERKNG